MKLSNELSPLLGKYTALTLGILEKEHEHGINTTISIEETRRRLTEHNRDLVARVRALEAVAEKGAEIIDIWYTDDFRDDTLRGYMPELRKLLRALEDADG